MSSDHKLVRETLSVRAWSVVLAFATVTLLDVALVPVRGGSLELSSGLAALALAAWDLAHAFALLGVLQLGLGLASLPHVGGARRVLRYALAAGLVAAEVAQVYARLTDYEPFTGQPAFIGAHAVLLIVLVVAECSRVSTSTASRIVAAGLVLAALVCVAATAVAFVGTYPTLHLALLGAALLLAQQGAQRLLGGATSRTRRFSAVVPAIWIAAAAVGCVLVRGTDDAERARLREGTAAGQYPLISSHTDPRVYECACVPPVPVDPKTSVETFLHDSGMPDVGDLRADDDHVLVVMIDSLRFDQTTLADPTLTTMPTLAAFVARGAFVFSRAFAPSSTTMQVVASLFMLSYPSDAGLSVERLRHWRGGLSTDRPTVPELLARSGYFTFASIHDGAAMMDGAPRGFSEYWNCPHMGAPTEDDQIVDHALANIDHRGDRRFFGWVFLGAPHDPYLPRNKTSVTPMERYRDEIRYADAQLGRLLAGLESRGLLDHTIVMVLGDHGEEFGEHGETHHAKDIFTEETHVPLVLWVPGARGTTVTKTVSTGYVLPWVMLAMTGERHDYAMNAIVSRLAPALVATRGAVVSELVSDTKLLVALRTDTHSTVHHLRLKTTTHFDLARDPQEAAPVSVEHANICTSQSPSADDEPLRAYLQLRACSVDYRVYDGLNTLRGTHR